MESSSVATSLSGAPTKGALPPAALARISRSMVSASSGCSRRYWAEFSLPLAELVFAVGVPGALFPHDTEVGTEVQQLVLAHRALVVEYVEQGHDGTAARTCS